MPLKPMGREAVIEVYNDAIVDPSYEAFGQIHLGSGQLQQAARRRSEAAYHFSKCIEDHRVDPPPIEKLFVQQGLMKI